MRAPVTCHRVITHTDGSGRLDDSKMRRLAGLVHATGSVIAISSNWRLFRELKARLTLALQNMGNIRVIGATPDHGERQHGGAVRPEEILAFLKAWRCALAPLPIPSRPSLSGPPMWETAEKIPCDSPARRPHPVAGARRSRRGAPSTTGRCTRRPADGTSRATSSRCTSATG